MIIIIIVVVVVVLLLYYYGDRTKEVNETGRNVAVKMGEKNEEEKKVKDSDMFVCNTSYFIEGNEVSHRVAFSFHSSFLFPIRSSDRTSGRFVHSFTSLLLFIKVIFASGFRQRNQKTKHAPLRTYN